MATVAGPVLGADNTPAASPAPASAREVAFAAPVRLDVPGSRELEGPELVDFDGDGKVDLLSGIYKGHLLFRKNEGTNAAPKFAAPVKLKSGGKDIKLTHW